MSRLFRKPQDRRPSQFALGVLLASAISVLLFFGVLLDMMPAGRAMSVAWVYCTLIGGVGAVFVAVRGLLLHRVGEALCGLYGIGQAMALVAVTLYVFSFTAHDFCRAQLTQSPVIEGSTTHRYSVLQGAVFCTFADSSAKRGGDFGLLLPLKGLARKA